MPGLAVVVVVGSWTGAVVVVGSGVVVVAGAVGSVLVVVGRAVGAVVGVARGTVVTVRGWEVDTAGVEVVVTSANAVVLVVVDVTAGEVVVVSCTPVARGAGGDGRPPVTSRRRAPRKSRANPYSATFTRYPVDSPAHQACTRPMRLIGSPKLG